MQLCEPCIGVGLLIQLHFYLVLGFFYLLIGEKNPWNSRLHWKSRTSFTSLGLVPVVVPSPGHRQFVLSFASFGATKDAFGRILVVNSGMDSVWLGWEQSTSILAIHYCCASDAKVRILAFMTSVAQLFWYDWLQSRVRILALEIHWVLPNMRCSTSHRCWCILRHHSQLWVRSLMLLLLMYQLLFILHLIIVLLLKVVKIAISTLILLLRLFAFPRARKDHLLVIRVAKLLIYLCTINHIFLILWVAKVESLVILQLLSAWIICHMLYLVVAKKRLSARFLFIDSKVGKRLLLGRVF